MSFHKYFIYIAIATLTTLSCVQMDNADEFTRDKYLGLWFVIRVMLPKSNCYPVYDCASVRVRIRGYNEWKFQQIDASWVNNVRNERSVQGKMIHSQIHLELNPDEADAVMNATEYNNGDELIILGKENRLLSRSRTASDEAIQAIRAIARRNNMISIPVSFDDC